MVFDKIISVEEWKKLIDKDELIQTLKAFNLIEEIPNSKSENKR